MKTQVSTALWFLKTTGFSNLQPFCVNYILKYGVSLNFGAIQWILKWQKINQRKGVGGTVLDMRWTFHMPAAGTAVSQQVLFRGFPGCLLHRPWGCCLFQQMMLERLGTTIPFGQAPMSALLLKLKHAQSSRMESKKMHPCPWGLWILPCACSGLSSLPQCTALWLLSVFGLRHKYHSWFPKTGLGRTNIYPEPPCTVFKTVVLNKFCGGIQSLLERNESLTSTSGGFGSGLTCLFLLLVQSLGFLPGIHWE